MADDVVAQPPAGRLRGVRDGHALRFLGVPYAQSPQVTGRFAAPLPHPHWDGVRDAGQYGASSAQPERGVTVIPEPLIPGDNELNLNVFTPDLGAAGLPVLVWIHGGGFAAGASSSPWYRGQGFARDGVVLVTINYRLGAPGFLQLPDAPVNRGLLDWVRALEWVHENIASFGGDPAKVTVAGQSAGGGACSALPGVPAAAGLFRSLICMSGGPAMLQTADGVQEVARQLTGQLGVPLTRDALEQLSPGVILAAQGAVMPPAGDPHSPEAVHRALEGIKLAWAPWVDGDVLADDPWASARSGLARRHPAAGRRDGQRGQPVLDERGLGHPRHGAVRPGEGRRDPAAARPLPGSPGPAGAGGDGRPGRRRPDVPGGGAGTGRGQTSRGRGGLGV